MRSTTLLPYLLSLALALILPVSSTHAAFPKLELELINENELLSPVGIINAGDGSNRLFIIEQRGQIRIIENGTLLATPFLDISGSLVTERNGFDERGLLGLAFHPDYATASAAGEGKFYVYYSAPSPDAPGTTEDPVNHMSVISEFQVSALNPDEADEMTERILLTFNQPQFNHNGGQLAFGPDGMLYISTGDGGSANDNNAGHTGGSTDRPSGVLGNAQDTTNLLGKILRIDPQGSNGPGGEYGIPADNPFVGDGNGVREEIYAYGLRNPWRFSFDDGTDGTGRLICADVGQGTTEEINLIVNGGNYGWRNKEGTFDFDATAPGTGPFIDPVAQYAHPGVNTGLPEIGLSVTGGFMYRGSEFPELQGHYIFADWSNGFGTPNGTLLALEEYAADTFSLIVPEVVGGNPIGKFIPAFGEDENGELYVATKTTLAPSATDPDTSLPTGAIWKIKAVQETGDPVSADISASKDNTIYSESVTNSNGAGVTLFSGRLARNDNLRRALLHFDVASALPNDVTIQSATLTLQVDKIAGFGLDNPADFSLHRLTKDWGEGVSDAGVNGGQGAPAQPGDATWTHNFFDTSSWTTAGGDFDSAASATTNVDGLGSYQWSGSGMVEDIQTFVDTPAQNFGWILKVPDTAPQGTAKRFRSRESNTNAPTLSVEATLPPPTNRENWEDTHFAPDTTVDYSGDLDDDSLIEIFEYSAGLDPNTANPTSDAYTFLLPPNETEGPITVVFRRDPRAEDLVYSVEVSDDLTNWDVIAESSGGAVTTGTGVVSDHPLPGDIPFREITVVDSFSPDTASKRFIRYRVSFLSP